MDARRLEEFYITSIRLGRGYPLLAIALIALLAQRVGSRALPGNDRLLFSVVAGSVATILFWCLLMYTPGSTIVHQGSLVWLLLLAAAGYAWIAERWRIPAVVVLLAQAALTLLVYIPGPAPLDLLAVAIGLLGAFMLLVVLLVSGRSYSFGSKGQARSFAVPS